MFESSIQWDTIIVMLWNTSIVEMINDGISEMCNEQSYHSILAEACPLIH